VAIDQARNRIPAAALQHPAAVLLSFAGRNGVLTKHPVVAEDPRELRRDMLMDALRAACPQRSPQRIPLRLNRIRQIGHTRQAGVQERCGDR
jgi:hypothetical protein